MSNSYNIDFDFAGVQTVITNTDNVYRNIMAIITAMNTEVNKLSQFWASSKESITFSEKLDKVYGDLQAFDAKYADFMAALEKVAEVYGENNANFSNYMRSVLGE